MTMPSLTNADFQQAYQEYVTLMRSLGAPVRTYNEWYRQFMGGSPVGGTASSTSGSDTGGYPFDPASLTGTGTSGTTSTATGDLPDPNDPNAVYPGYHRQAMSDGLGGAFYVWEQDTGTSTQTGGSTRTGQFNYDASGNEYELVKYGDGSSGWERTGRYDSTKDSSGTGSSNITPYQQSQIDLQKEQLATDRWQAEEQLKETARQRRSAMETSIGGGFIQPWMQPLMSGQYNNLQVGQEIPNWLAYLAKQGLSDQALGYGGGTSGGTGGTGTSTGAGTGGSVWTQPQTSSPVAPPKNTVPINPNIPLPSNVPNDTAAKGAFPMLNAPNAGQLVEWNRGVTAGTTGGMPANAAEYLPGSADAYKAQQMESTGKAGGMDFLNQNPDFMPNATWMDRLAAAKAQGLLPMASGGTAQGQRAIMVGERGPEIEMIPKGQWRTIIPIKPMANGGYAGSADWLSLLPGTNPPTEGGLQPWGGTPKTANLPGWWSPPTGQIPNVDIHYPAPTPTTPSMSPWGPTTGTYSPPQQVQTGNTDPKTYGGSDLPWMRNPSAQYLSRMGPTGQGQLASYMGLATGMTPEEWSWRMWSAAPPSGANVGTSWSRR